MVITIFVLPFNSAVKYQTKQHQSGRRRPIARQGESGGGDAPSRDREGAAEATPYRATGRERRRRRPIARQGGSGGGDAPSRDREGGVKHPT